MDTTSPYPLSLPPSPDSGERSAHVRAEDLLVEMSVTRSLARRRSLETEVLALTWDLADQAARRYHGRGVDDEDLQQVARLALLKAIRRYRPGLGACFPAFAVPTITGEVKRHFRDCGWAVRPPRRLQERRVTLARQEETLRQELQREPTLAELAGRAGLSCDDVREVMAAASGYSTTSLDGSAAGGDSRVEVPDPHDPCAALEEREALRWAMRSLTEQELEVLRLRFAEDLTQSQIGHRIGVSQMQVSRLLAGILGRLRAAMTTEEAVA
ncbi:sigma-70 family RNA polymerase sigma factor [Phycicoccus sp. M110.8]|uniref:sigma-70 family RNA polymerase sigma factor n=1 Tax=Phycicoccus sp. M110.8 TaxID=3075433 RepID=UPI0028FD3DB3|nr:sigma-70 family RNA polymerase sigma factor [Phycicoccus sp. M110.8]MDU0315387.1 sigma-70 family RNA polymerase sigma factor [Phycicoccus sp. M110.8]